ncbi:uncharacterized protein DUF1523 [Gemmobacter caeni]|uniref:Uncharacterized protein DUF1523 n=1 Tax=Gemmobacter caeni TaxID=589035 RepID=A0A2T6B4B2_9RHOB|nr:DUF1523 family protein [Gemmobacter caeni]PTX50901.1 uncharacterized protein DUF1523 [Gemmobacter caeni]TWI93589.1 uncharacterized protein DUF1523 [Gemmobacter caeni]
MWKYIKWGFRITVLIIVAAFLHYTLPQRDIVRITGTYNRLTEVGANSIFYASPDSGTTTNTVDRRDIRFIEAAYPDGGPMVYRNEDTGWIWPPYFKYDSSNLQAEATNAISPKDKPEWVAVTHYGWRLPIFSIYPNAVKIKPVAGPDVRLIPWVNIVVLVLLGLLVLMLWRMWAQFKERMIEPAMDDLNNTLDAVDARADAARDRARGFWGRLFGRK